MEKGHLPQEQGTQKNWNTYLLQKIAEVTDEQIEKFKQKILKKEKKDIFEEVPEDRKLIVVALDNLSDDELQEMENYMDRVLKQTKKGVYFPGIHNLGNQLSLMMNLTQRNWHKNPKANNIVRRDKPIKPE